MAFREVTETTPLLSDWERLDAPDMPHEIEAYENVFTTSSDFIDVAESESKSLKPAERAQQKTWWRKAVANVVRARKS
ncbi:hypothetical protein EPUS_01495 [Endocarpon pusillum Z07020]|uniref:Uncharacterized protein n=1 Tax=Endocarpon pusillum (strain Z07020 / HMAS-L-300199) TaxID=1263415 RepID=U1GVR6_ENDPU|nr:uncharacterized protein EPUS_01495 [Endocarpon pusillum Z07020]ERF76161.1 hypothetical protein EPUS_01495 [Endocarpon pusillum Z07020]